jgi:hypothetical protein
MTNQGVAPDGSSKQRETFSLAETRQQYGESTYQNDISTGFELAEDTVFIP